MGTSALTLRASLRTECILARTLREMDSWRDVSIWQSLCDENVAGAPLLRVLEAESEFTPALIARLRRQFDSSRISAAIELIQARRRAVGKLDFAARCNADCGGVEMASSSRCALWKAERFRDARLRHLPILDLCSGMGSDLKSLVDLCGEARVLGVEHDPLRAWMARGNARTRVREADVASQEIQSMLSDSLVHCDPPRRDQSGRVWKRGAQTSDEFELASLLGWMRRSSGGALKLGPGIARELVRADDVECEFVEVHGTMEQCVVWTGALATHAGVMRATRLGRESHSRVGSPRAVPQAEALGAFVFEPCAAIERAGLLGDLAEELRAGEIAHGLGLLTAAQACDSPWAECFEMVGAIARSPQEAVAKRSAESAQEEFRSVRVRGKALDAFGGVDRVTKSLACESDGTLVLHAWRSGAKSACVVTRIVG